MNHKFPPLPVRIAVAVIVIGTLAYFGYRSLNNTAISELTASGTIEATIVNVAPEISGKVTEVLAQESQPVKMNDPLLHLDPNLLTAQRAVAAASVDSANAALASAQVKYDQALQAAIAAQDAQRAKDLKSTAPTGFDQPGWYFDQAEQADSAKVELDNAQSALDDANANLQTVISDLKNSNYLKAEKRLADARAAFVIADTVKDEATSASNSGGLLDAANDYLEIAQTELDDAQTEYDDELTTDEADDVEYARGKVIAAQQRYYAAYSRWLSFQTGEESPAVVSALRSLEQAKSAVTQADANLALLDTQVAKLTIVAPIDGVILARNVEPGEFVQPGAVALTMADLTNLTITVYVPENLYGQIALGQTAEVRVDSFPDLVFTATVVHIADQAEFTPRNVQTVEGRSSTFYAIKLKVADPDGKLKIGMPADVVFK
ncbi:MAG: HlyD family efflux transporter periplasmic adaptor subunit [Anaerolineales bacterium]|nr:HlyD family efflux transporter periplasmic adaptor subunit [Anaerolineales bacterium]